MILLIYNNKYMLNKCRVKVSKNHPFVISWGIEMQYQLGVFQKDKGYLKYELKRHNLVNLGHFTNGNFEATYKQKKSLK